MTRGANLLLGLLLTAGPAVAVAAPPSETVTVTVTGKHYQDSPDGKGDPDETTCRKPQQLPGSRLMAPPTCMTNRQWAALRQAGQDVSPDGRIKSDSEKARTLNPPSCLVPPIGGATGAFSSTATPICF